jgi:hypothetical protein
MQIRHTNGRPKQARNAKLKTFFYVPCTDVDNTDRAIQVGGAREGQSFVLKI